MSVRQSYHAHSLFRTILRNKNIKKNKQLIEKNKNTKILVIIHLFYPKSWKEIREYLNNLSCYDYDLIITTTIGMIPSTTLENIRKFKSSVRIIECENRGFDLRPFLLALRTVNLDNYEIVIKLQSKSTKRAWIYIYEQLFLRRDWFLDLFEGVLSAKVVHKNIDLLRNNKSIGLVAANNLIVKDPPHKVQMVQKIAVENGLSVPNNYKFVAGTCFAVKAECLKKIQIYPWTDEDFKSVPNTRGMSFAHFFERYICTQVESEYGMKMVGVPVRNLHHAIFSGLNKILYRYSSNRLYDENIDFDAEYFYWQLDNRLIKWRYEEVPFKKIMYSNDGVRRPLVKNAPYLYLKGNTKIYEEYCAYHKKNNLPVMSIERFEKLRNSIKENGYDERHIIILNDKNELMDGQHRAACLCDERGEDATVKVLKIHFIGFKSLLKKILPYSVQNKIRTLKNKL